MKRVTIDIDALYANVITFTLVGTDFGECRVTSLAADLNKGTHFVVGQGGKITQVKDTVKNELDWSLWDTPPMGGFHDE